MMKAVVTLALLFVSTSAVADERILTFRSDIAVHPDGSMGVTEEITVRAEGERIRRGIYRDFPTDYRDRFGNRYRVDFDVLSVRRDGVPEAYHAVREGDGVRVYMGDRDHLLAPGDYRYELSYRTDRQLGFFADHDELYWNVTGNDWDFPIESVTASVTLPESVPPAAIGVEAYTGVRGAKGQDYAVVQDGRGDVALTSSLPFAPGEGMTIVVTWPKGHVAPPTPEEEAVALFRDNRTWVVAVSGLGLLLIYYLVVWFRVGRDPERGVIIVQYDPPAGFSPASARYIVRMGYDHKSFAAAVVNLAVKGVVEIIEEENGFVLKRTRLAAEDLAPGERVLLKSLFGGVNNAEGKRQALDRKYHVKIRKALKAHEESLRNNFEKRYFVTNKWWIVPGLLLSFLSFAAAVASLGDSERLATGAFLSLWLAGWSVGLVVLGLRVVNAWQAARSAGTFFGALFITAFAVPFVTAEVVVLWVLATQVSPALPVLIIGAAGVTLLFYELLKAPTRAGRRLIDRIEGFRMFLEVAEKDELNLRNPPDRTPQLFERFLPFALALDVEQHWMNRFADQLAGLSGGEGGYRPAWYHGRSWNAGHPSLFVDTLGDALSSAVAASATAPGSTSGSGGGGSSGGGGGGGGGGGW